MGKNGMIEQCNESGQDYALIHTQFSFSHAKRAFADCFYLKYYI